MTASQGVTHRVRYADTDAMGVVYNAVYLVWFEAARTEWLRARGLPYREVSDRGISLPVTEASVRFRSPARYDDLVTIEADLRGLRSRGVAFDYVVRLGDRLLAEGWTLHVAVETATGRSVRMPAWLVESMGNDPTHRIAPRSPSNLS
jgi:acyl-CoA thioester hydrolase